MWALAPAVLGVGSNLVLAAKKANPKSDTSALEKQINELVYKLYDLTEAEIAIIENRK